MSLNPENSDIPEIDPLGAWEIIETDPDAVLIDVRSQAEWSFVGVPDLSELGKATITVEWAQFPGMSKNPHFVVALTEQIGTPPKGPLLFLCRSGVRSLHAARAVRQHFDGLGEAVVCINVAEGFEGDLDVDGHRGRLGGWRFHGLAWRQS